MRRNAVFANACKRLRAPKAHLSRERIGTLAKRPLPHACTCVGAHFDEDTQKPIEFTKQLQQPMPITKCARRGRPIRCGVRTRPHAFKRWPRARPRRERPSAAASERQLQPINFTPRMTTRLPSDIAKRIHRRRSVSAEDRQRVREVRHALAYNARASPSLSPTSACAACLLRFSDNTTSMQTAS